MPKKENDGRQFFTLRPKGVGSEYAQKKAVAVEKLDSKDKERLLKEISACEKYRRAGMAALSFGSGHVDRREKYAYSKRTFLLNEPGADNMSLEKLVYILADRKTLFNKNFQSHAYSRWFFSSAAAGLEACTEKVTEDSEDDMWESYRVRSDQLAEEAERRGVHIGNVLEKWVLEKSTEAGFPLRITILFEDTAEDRAIRKELGRYTLERRLDDLIIYEEDMETENWLPEALRDYEEDSARVRGLKDLCDSYKKWREQGEPLLPSSQTNMLTYKECEDICRKLFDEIYDAVLQFFDSSRRSKGHNLPKPDPKYTKQVLHTMVTKLRTTTPMPFTFLMVCVTQKQHFYSVGTPDVQKALTEYSSPVLAYHARPAYKTQRLERIRFLDRFIEIFGLSPEDARKNWRCFLDTHGDGILTEAEAVLWKDITRKVPGIVPIEVQLSGKDCLDDCLPAMPEEFGCYENASPLQLDGFSRYVKDYPEVISQLKKQIPQRSKVWPKNVKDYFEHLYSEHYDLDTVKILCRHASESKKIRWEEIPHAALDEQKTFCETQRKRIYNRPVNASQIEKDVVELRSLLIEYVLWEISADYIKRLLAKSFDKALNPRNDKFGISLFRWCFQQRQSAISAAVLSPSGDGQNQ